MLDLCQSYPDGQYLPLIQIAETHGISKIYLEQVFSLLKRAGLVISTKGTQGGYRLARPAGEITVLQILEATEHSLMESSETTVQDSAPHIEKVLQERVYSPLNASIAHALDSIALESLYDEAVRNRPEGYMFYI